MGNLDKLTKSLERLRIDRFRPLKREQSNAMSPKSEMLRDVKDSHLTAVRKRIRYLGRELQNIQSDYARLWLVTRRKSSVKDNSLSKHLFGNHNILVNRKRTQNAEKKKVKQSKFPTARPICFHLRNPIPCLMKHVLDCMKCEKTKMGPIKNP